jgi:hypothetical protein
LEVGQRASVTAGCTATFKLRAMQFDLNNQCFSMSYEIAEEIGRLALPPILGNQPKN